MRANIDIFTELAPLLSMFERAGNTWPPSWPDYTPDNPAWLDTASPTAFNESFARQSFGDSVVDVVLRPQLTFSGDVWMLAALHMAAERATYLDFDGDDTERFAWWNTNVSRWSGYSIARLHLEHADLSALDLRYVNLERARLDHANLAGSRLYSANLESAHLSYATCQNAALGHTNMRNAVLNDVRFGSASLDSTSLEGADLRNADLTGTYLYKARLTDANLIGASLAGARCHRVHLARARMDHADVRLARGLLFDRNPVERLHIDGSADDPWSQLRREYTGPRFFFHLLLLIAFLLPFAAHVLSLSIVSDGYLAAERVGSTLPSDTPVAAATDSVVRSFKESHDRVPAVWVLIGGVKGIVYVVLTGLMILYNLLRAVLTTQVAMLRDAEERSRITPSLSDYYGLRTPVPAIVIPEEQLYGIVHYKGVHSASQKRAWLHAVTSPVTSVGLVRVHAVARLLFWLSLASFILHAIAWVATTWVWVPRVP